LRGAVRAGGLATVHDISEGGLACAVAECCIEGGVGARIELPETSAATLFGEGPGGVVIAGPREAVEAVEGARVIGAVGGDVFEIAGALSIPVERLREVYEGAIPAALSG
jgi:phosphoribosylformylglycinamidine (FGAM) synthase-like enzyme